MTSPDNSSPHEAGFTLIELTVVFAILALILVLLIGRGFGPSRTLNLRASANQLAADLREARAEAIASDRATALLIDFVHRVWQPPNGITQVFPASTNIRLVTIAGNLDQNGSGRISFDPDGSSSGGRIELVDGTTRIDIGIDWLTGRVSVGNAP